MRKETIIESHPRVSHLCGYGGVRDDAVVIVPAMLTGLHWPAGVCPGHSSRQDLREVDGVHGAGVIGGAFLGDRQELPGEGGGEESKSFI